MSRPLAADHDEKRSAFLKAAATVFARHGYDRASMTDVAAGASMSKALIYHYYANKEQLLVAIIRDHLVDLNDATAQADEARLTPRARLRALIGALIDAYRDADDEHQIQINELRKLPEPAKAELLDLERALVKRFSAALEAAVPALKSQPAMLKPVTMSLFGMINWKYMWFREGGPITREGYADLVTDMIVAGAQGALGSGALGSGALGSGAAEARPPRLRPL